MAIKKKGQLRQRRRSTISQFTDWKERAMERMIADDELTKLLYYPTEDWHSKPKLTAEEREGLLHKHIFPYRFTNESVETKKSFISMGLAHFTPQEGYRQFSDDYMMGYFYIYILVDVDIIPTEMGCRQDLIASRIYELFQETVGIGMGEMRLETTLELWQHNNKFGGYTLGFRVIDMK